MKHGKRFLALLLALTMVLGMLPAAAAQQTVVSLLSELEEIPVSDDQTLLQYLQDGVAQRLVLEQDMTLFLEQDLETEDELCWGVDGILSVVGGTLTCARADMLAFNEAELEEALGDGPYWNLAAPVRNIWVLENVDLSGVTVPADRTLSWVAVLGESAVSGNWPELENLYVPEGAELTVDTDLTVNGLLRVDGVLSVADGVRLEANAVEGSGSLWWRSGSEVTWNTVDGVIYPHGDEYEIDGTQVVDVYDVPSLLYYLTDGTAQAVNVSADLRLPLDTDLVSEDSLFVNHSVEEAMPYRLEVLGEGTLTVAEFALPAWDQEELDAFVAGTYPIRSEGMQQLILESDFSIGTEGEALTLPDDISLCLGGYGTLDIRSSRLTAEGGIYNMVLGMDMDHLNKGSTLKHNALLTAIYFDEMTGRQTHVFYQSEADFLADWAEKKDTYSCVNQILISADGDTFEITGDWTVTPVGGIATQDETVVSVQSGAKVSSDTIEFFSISDTDACLLTLESGAEVQTGHLYVEGSAYWPADMGVFFGSADIRYYAPMLFFRVLGWDDGRQVHVDDPEYGGYSEWPLRVSPVQEKVGYVAYCYPADPDSVPAGADGWVFGPLDEALMDMTEGLEFELLEEDLRDYETVPWESYRVRTDRWSKDADLGVSYTEGGYTMPLHIDSSLNTVGFYSSPAAEEQYALGALNCDTFSGTQEEFYLIFRPEYDGQYVDRIEVLSGDTAAVTATEDANIWKVSVSSAESFSLDLCLYVRDQWSEPWEWYDGIWVDCGSTSREIIEITTAEALLEGLQNAGSEQYAAMKDIIVELTGDLVSSDYVGSGYDDNGKFYQTKFTGSGTLTVAEYEAVVNNEAEWTDAVSGLSHVDADRLYIFVNGTVEVSESVDLAEKELYFPAVADLRLAPGVTVSTWNTLWNLNYADMSGQTDLAKDLSLKHNAFADVIFRNDGEETLRVIYADEATFLADLPEKLARYPYIDLLILSTDDGNGNYGAAEIDGDWSLLRDRIDTLAVQDGTTLTVSTDLELRELVLEDADDESTRTDVVALYVTGGAELTVRDYVYIEGGFACDEDSAGNFRGHTEILGGQAGLLAMYLDWDEGQIESEHITDYLGRTLPVDEHRLMFFVQTFENGQWVRTPVIPEADGVEIRSVAEEAAPGQENADYFVAIRTQDLFCEQTYTAELNGQTYTMEGDSHVNEVEFFSVPYNDYQNLMTGAGLSPVEDNTFYAVVTDESLRWSNVELFSGSEVASMEDTDDYNVKKITVTAEAVREMRASGQDFTDIAVKYDVSYPDGYADQGHAAGMGIWVENGMVFREGLFAEVPTDTVLYADIADRTMTTYWFAPGDSATGILYYVWFREDDGQWVADCYTGDRLWQDGDSIRLEPELDQEGNETGRTVITGLCGGQTGIHHTGFHEENGEWVPNDGGIWHGVPFPVHVGKTAFVTSVEEVEAALADETVTELCFQAPITVAEDLTVDKPCWFTAEGYITVTGDAVLTLVEPSFEDTVQLDTDFWLLFDDEPDGVRTCYLCGDHAAAQRQAAKFGGSVMGMHTDIVAEEFEGVRRIVFDGDWPELTVEDSALWGGNVYVIDGADLSFGRLYSQGHGVSDDMTPDQLDDLVEGLTGSLTVTEQLTLRGNAYWTPEFTVRLPETFYIMGGYPHLSGRWLNNDGNGWYEWEEDRLVSDISPMQKGDNLFMTFYATVPQVSGGEITWTTEPVTVTDGGSAVTPIQEIEYEQIAEGSVNGAYFTRVSAESYDWNTVIPLRATAGAYTLSLDIPVELPQTGYFTAPEYKPEYYVDRFRLSEDPEENVLYLIAVKPENADYRYSGYDFTQGSDRILTEELEEGIIKITLQDGVDVYEAFSLRGSVTWETDHEEWRHICGMWIEGAENTEPYLSFSWLDNYGGGWFVSEDSLLYPGTEILAPWWYEHFVMFRLHRYDETHGWIAEPVEVELDRPELADLIRMTENPEEYLIREDALLGGSYFYHVVPHADVWDETLSFTCTMEDGTELTVPLRLGREEFGFYSEARISNETYITEIILDPAGNNVFYLGADVPQNEDGSPAYTVEDVWVQENEWSHLVRSVNRLSNQLWQIELTEEAGHMTDGFNLDVVIQIDYGDWTDQHWRGIWCGLGNRYDTADAVFTVNEAEYFFFDGTDRVMKSHETENGWETVWLDAMDVEGFAYDLSTNTITLTDAQLTNLALQYWRGWTDENGDNVIEGYSLPDAAVTVVLQGTSTVRSDRFSALDLGHGVSVTLCGDGTLNLIAEESAEIWGNPAVNLYGGASLTVSESARVIAETRDHGTILDENGEPWTDENGQPMHHGLYAVQGDYSRRTSLTVEDNAYLKLSGTEGGLDCVSTVIFRGSAVVETEDLCINAEETLRPSMTVADSANVTVTANPGESFSRPMDFLGGGRLYMKGGVLTVDSTAEPQQECAVGFGSHMGKFKGGLQMTGGELNIRAAGGSGIGLSNGNVYEQHGGTVNVTVGAESPEYWGSWGMTTDPRTEFILTGGTANFTGTQCDDCNSAGILYRSNDGTVAGGSLNCTGVHLGGDVMVSGIYVAMGSLNITGGNHQCKVVNADGTDNLHSARGVGLVVEEGGYLTFNGGKTRLAGYGAAWSFGANNGITLGTGLHAVSNASGNELSMVYYEETYTYEDGIWTDRLFWFEEDNLVTYPEGAGPYDESDMSHDVTVSAAKGTAAVNGASVDIAVTNGAPALGAKMSFRIVVGITEGGKAKVDVKLPVKLELLEGSIYVDGEAVSSLTGIEIDGPSVLRFDAVPLESYAQNIAVTVSADGRTVGEGVYGFMPGPFEVSAPSHSESSTVTLTGKAHPGYTVKVADQANNVVTAEVNELGTFTVRVNSLVSGPNVLRVYLNDAFMKEVVVNYSKPAVQIRSLTIRNNVHDSAGNTVEELVEILYPGGKPSRTFYTYWPGQDVFTLEVSVPGAPADMVLEVVITDADGQEHRVVLTEIRDGFYKGYFINRDPDSPPVGFEVHWLRITWGADGEPEDEGHTVKTELIPIMDPSGFVYEDTEQNRVADARVTLEFGGTGASPADAVDWDAEAYGQINGYLTNVNGEFRWDVPKGWWRVRVEKDGYADTFSDWMQVPPPQLGVAIDIGPSRLEENKIALVETARISEDGHLVTVAFTRPVAFEDVEDLLVITDGEGRVPDGALHIGQLLERVDGDELVNQVSFRSYDIALEQVQVRFDELAGSAFDKNSVAVGVYQPMAITAVTKQAGQAVVFLDHGSRSAGRELLVVASYTAEGQFLRMDTAPAVSGRNEVACAADAGYVKAFVVESMETMIPLCEAESGK